MKSILQDFKECLITGETYGLHEHHVFGGSNRKNSERYGLKVYLVGRLHNLSNEGVHSNKELDTKIKQWAQRKAMAHYNWSIEEFRGIFGKNYL